MKTYVLIKGVILLIATLPLQTVVADQDNELEPGKPRHGCFYSREASNFDALDNRNLIVYAPTKSRAYHVQIAPPSNELRFVEGIAFDGRDGRVCGYAGETVSFGGRGAGRRYSITNVWRLDEAQLAQLKDQYRSPDGDQQIEPKETEGAEIER